MRIRLLSVLFVAATLGATLTSAQVDPPAAPADEATAPETEPAPAAPAEAAAKPDISTKVTTNETTVLGDVPLGPGHWLVLADLDVGGKRRTVPAFWEVEVADDGKPVVTERFVTVPLDMNQGLEAKNQEGVLWQPTGADLTRLLEEWETLPDQMRGVQTVKNELWGKEAFTDEIKSEKKTKDAAWVVRQVYQFVPGDNRPMRQVNVFAVREQNDRGFTGGYSGVAVALAPFPVPIVFEGTFRMIHLDSTPAPQGFLARLADLFTGCGR